MQLIRKDIEQGKKWDSVCAVLCCVDCLVVPHFTRVANGKRGNEHATRQIWNKIAVP
jgi:hypothetical protein